ncbi:hypothetical protein GYB22_03340 [bacterium]|nr:hypothetical protein [bacterium]
MKSFHPKLVLIFLLLFSAIDSSALLTAPTGQIPADNSTDVVTSPRLSFAPQWNKDYWVFEVSEDSNFNTDVTRVTSDYYNTYANALAYNTKYYWRGRYYDNNDSSHWSTTLSFTTGTKATIYSPADGAELYGAIYLTVYRSNHEFYEYLLDTTADFNSTLFRRRVESDSAATGYWENTEFDSLYFGINYYMKVRSFEDGDTSEWSVVHQIFSTTRYQYRKFLSRNLTSVKISWVNYPGIVKYEVQFDTDTFYNSPDLVEFDKPSEQLNNEIWIHELNFDTKYYWRLRAISAVDTFTWSSSESLSTDDIRNPDIGYYCNTEIDYFQDDAIHGTQLQLDTVADFSSPYLLDSFIMTDTSSPNGYFVTIPAENLYYGRTYFVRIRGFHSKDTSDWKLRTRTISPFGQLRYPYTNDIVSPGDSVTFDNSKRHGNYFRIQIDSTSDFSSVGLFDTVITETNEFLTYFRPKLDYSKTYYWRIKVANENDTSVWSNIQVTRTFNTLSYPNLVYPYEGWNTGTIISPEIRWDKESNTHYQIQLDTSPNFNSAVLYDSLVTEYDGKHKVEHLYFDQEYYCRVRFVKGNLKSDWCPTRNFNTIREIRDLDPEQNDSNIYPISLDWRSITGTTGYIMRLDTNSDLSTARVDTVMEENAFFHYLWVYGIELDFDQEYFYQVSLFHPKDTLDSEIIRFITRSRQAPVHNSPADGSTDVPLNINLSWKAYSGSNTNGYLIEYSENPDMSDSVAKYVTGTGHNPNLTFNKTYYWRVRAMYNTTIVTSDYSEPWSFTTIKGYPQVILTSPANGANDVKIDTKLKWEPAQNASEYTIEIGLDPDFLGKFTRTSSINELEFSFSKNKTYYWRVKYKRNGVSSPWSEAWTFTTGERSSSIEDIAEIGVKVYPVPASEVLNVDCRNSTFRPVMMINAMGQEVFVQSYADATPVSAINVSGFAKGVYTLVFTDGVSLVRRTILIN